MKHQQKKKDAFVNGYTEDFKKHGANPTFDAIVESRRSQRIFTGTSLDFNTINSLLWYATQAPSSCNRGGVVIKRIDLRDDKELLGGLLVGGVGWIHRADVVFLLFADQLAYKANGEVKYMPYLDGGVMIQTLLLAAERMNIAAAYINPNIRDENVEFFNKRFNPNKFVYLGAIALGNYDKRPVVSEKRSIDELSYDNA